MPVWASNCAISTGRMAALEEMLMLLLLTRSSCSCDQAMPGNNAEAKRTNRPVTSEL